MVFYDLGKFGGFMALLRGFNKMQDRFRGCLGDDVEVATKPYPGQLGLIVVGGIKTSRFEGWTFVIFYNSGKLGDFVALLRGIKKMQDRFRGCPRDEVEVALILVSGSDSGWRNWKLIELTIWVRGLNVSWFLRFGEIWHRGITSRGYEHEFWKENKNKFWWRLHRLLLQHVKSRWIQLPHTVDLDTRRHLCIPVWLGGRSCYNGQSIDQEVVYQYLTTPNGICPEPFARQALVRIQVQSDGPPSESLSLSFSTWVCLESGVVAYRIRNATSFGGWRG